MKRTWKKALALLLAVVLCVSLLPMGALAGMPTGEYTPQNVKVQIKGTETDTDEHAWLVTEVSWDANNAVSMCELYATLTTAEGRYDLPAFDARSAYSIGSGEGYPEAFRWTTSNGRNTLPLKIRILGSEETQIAEAYNNYQTANGIKLGDTFIVELTACPDEAPESLPCGEVLVTYTAENVANMATFTETQRPVITLTSFLLVNDSSAPKFDAAGELDHEIQGGEVYLLTGETYATYEEAKDAGGMASIEIGGSWRSAIAIWTLELGSTLTASSEGGFTVTGMFPECTLTPGDEVYAVVQLDRYRPGAYMMFMTEPMKIIVPAVGSSAEADISAATSPKITTAAALTAGAIGEPYSFQFAGEAAESGALSWSLSEGSALPAGLSLSQEGVLSGTPTAAGEFSFALVLREANLEKTASRSFSLKIKGQAPTIDTQATLTEATWGKPYTAALAGTAGTAGGPLVWTLTAGELPAGLSLTEGVITGTPAMSAEGSHTFTLSLADAGTETASREFTLLVKKPADPSITTSSLPTAKEFKAYRVPLSGTASLGGSLSWSLEGALPAGLSLTEGVISGTPAEGTAGEYPLTLTLTETQGDFVLTAAQTLTLTVAEPSYYNVSFIMNGGTGAEGADYSTRVILEDNAVILPAAPERRGYRFTGWRISGTVCAAGAELTVTSNLYAYAQWEENAPLAVAYGGAPLAGNVSLRGEYTTENGSQIVYLTSACYEEPTVPQLTIRATELYRDYTRISLWAHVDGLTCRIASFEGGIPAGAESIALNPEAAFADLTPVTGIAVTGLTAGTDYQLRSLYVNGRYDSLPFMTAGSGTYKVYLRGVETSGKYEQYRWDKNYDAVLSGGTLTVTPEKAPDGLYVSGTVSFGGKPLAGVQVQVSQHIYGQDRNGHAVTDGAGSFLIEDRTFDPSVHVYVTVLSGGQRMEGRSFLLTADGENPYHAQALSVAVSTAIVTLKPTLDLSASSLTAAQEAAVRDIANDYLRIAFTEGSNNTSGYFYSGSDTVLYPTVSAPDSTVTYTVTGERYIADTAGSVTLSAGAATAELTLQPNPAVLVRLSSPIYSEFSLAWFNSAGSCVGVSNSFTLYSGTDYVLRSCPAQVKTGTFTVVLIPASAMGVKMESLTDLTDEQALNRWSVTLGEHEIKVLEDFALDKAASENAAYVTKPNSTLFADRESFAAAGDLLRFTGSIGLDSGMTGTLTYLQISPKNVNDNVSYSNSAVIQSLVIGGKAYGADSFRMSSFGEYSISFDSPIELPCDYTLYCKPGSEDWDVQLSMYAGVNAGSQGYGYQYVGEATVKKPGASITTLSSYVCDKTIAVKGTAKPNTTVDIYDGNILVATATADRKGLWSARITLANTDGEYVTTHVLTSRTDTARSDELYVFHDPNGPQLTSFTMQFDEYGQINVGDAYTYRGSMTNLTFKAKFKNPDKLQSTEYAEGKTSKAAFVYYLTNGTIATVYATQSGDTFTATLDKTLYSSVAAAEVLFDPILNNRPAQDGVYALSATDLAEYADTLNAAQNATLFSNTVDLSYTANNEVLTGINEQYAGTGMEVQALTVEYDDEASFLKWMNDSAAEWISGNPEGNTVGMFNKSVVFADKADYDAQLAKLKAYAAWQSALENSDSSVTGGQFFFTDMQYDAELNLINEGTYIAEFNAFSDTGRGLYAIIGALALDSSFQHYAADLPDNEDAVLMWFWGNEASNRDNVSTTERAIQKYVQGGGIQKLFEQGPPNPVGIYYDVKNNATEYIETTAASEMQALGARVDAGMIENSKEFQEVQNAKSYYDTINPFSSFRSSGYDHDGPPTIGDRIDQINKDIEALRAIDGKLPLMDARFIMEIMNSVKDVSDLAGFLSGGADLNPTSPFFKFLQDIPGIVCDKMTMDQLQERIDIYNRMMYNWNYVQNWYNSEIGFGDERFAPKENNGTGDNGGDNGGSGTGGGGTGGGDSSGGGVKDDTGTSSGSRAREIADRSKTRKPPITNKVSNDPSGIVFEGVMENPVEGAVVTLYYAATDGGDLVKQNDNLDLATQLLPADGVDDLIPAAATQTTGPDGRYGWGVPEGLWFVKAEYAGLTGNSNSDSAATVGKTVGEANMLLPVLPVQLEVNIPLTDSAVPAVTEARYTQEGVYVTFSKYMQNSCLLKENYAVGVTRDGVYTARDDVTITPILQGHVPANLPGAGTTYTKTVLINIPDLALGDQVVWSVEGSVSSYAGTPLGSSCGDSGTAAAPIQLGAPTMILNGVTPIANGGGAEVKSGDRLVLELPAGTPAHGSIRYRLGEETTVRTYTQPLDVSAGGKITAWVEAAGYVSSPEVTAAFTLPSGGEAFPGALTADRTSLSVTAGSAAQVTLTLKKGSGAPLAGWTISAVSGDAATAAATASAVTGENGTAAFTITGVKAGSTAVTFTAAGTGLTVSLSVTVTPLQSGYPQTVQTEAAAEVTGEGEITASPDVTGGKAEAEITGSTVAQALKQAEAGDELTVRVDTENAHEVAVTLTAEAVKNMAEADVDLRVETETGTVKLSAETLDALAESGKDAVVTVKNNGDGTTTLDVTAGGEAAAAKVKAELPAGKDGQMLVMVLPDGTEQIIKKSLAEEGTMYAELPAGATVKAVDAETAFPDVAEGAWYAPAVEFVAGRGLFQGTDRGFEPQTTMTRAMLATVLFRLEDAAASGTNPFPDVAEGTWYTDAVTWASSVGIVNGTDRGFEPDAPVTREQIAAMLYRYAALLGLDTTGRAGLDAFPDGGETSPWAAEAMAWAVSVGLFRGNADGTLNPGGNATRAEVAALLQRMVGLMVK